MAWAGGALACIGYRVDLEGIETQVVDLNGEREFESFLESWRGWSRANLPPRYVEARTILAPPMSWMTRQVHAKWEQRGEPIRDWLEEESAMWPFENHALFRPADKRIYIMNLELPPPFVRLGVTEPWHIAVHEAAHVGQIELGLDMVGNTTEEMLIRKALIEGEADLALLAVCSAMDGMPLAVRSDGWVRAELRRLFARPQESPSYVGCTYLLPAFRSGGWPSVRTAVAAPPASSEQILHPAQRGQDEPTAVDLPPWLDICGPPSWVFEDVCGEYGIAWLAQGAHKARFDGKDPPAKADVAAGWDGDRLAVAVFSDGTQAAMWRTVWDSNDDAEDFTELFQPEFEGSMARSDQVVDWAWSTDPAFAKRLIEAMAEVRQVRPDCESTGAIEER